DFFIQFLIQHSPLRPSAQMLRCRTTSLTAGGVGAACTDFLRVAYFRRLWRRQAFRRLSTSG
ncbi:MAG: hypothetical protein IKC94_01595, partial [Lentisphaeria bacterium]|nr:hypothetical protein [Lentisphaeria bacterium]